MTTTPQFETLLYGTNVANASSSTTIYDGASRVQTADVDIHEIIEGAKERWLATQCSVNVHANVISYAYMGWTLDTDTETLSLKDENENSYIKISSLKNEEYIYLDSIFDEITFSTNPDNPLAYPFYHNFLIENTYYLDIYEADDTENLTDFSLNFVWGQYTNLIASGFAVGNGTYEYITSADADGTTCYIYHNTTATQYYLLDYGDGFWENGTEHISYNFRYKIPCRIVRCIGDFNTQLLPYVAPSQSTLFYLNGNTVVANTDQYKTLIKVEDKGDDKTYKNGHWSDSWYDSTSKNIISTATVISNNIFIEDDESAKIVRNGNARNVYTSYNSVLYNPSVNFMISLDTLLKSLPTQYLDPELPINSDGSYNYLTFANCCSRLSIGDGNDFARTPDIYQPNNNVTPPTYGQLPWIIYRNDLIERYKLLQYLTHLPAFENKWDNGIRHACNSASWYSGQLSDPVSYDIYPDYNLTHGETFPTWPSMPYDGVYPPWWETANDDTSGQFNDNINNLPTRVFADACTNATADTITTDFPNLPPAHTYNYYFSYEKSEGYEINYNAPARFTHLYLENNWGDSWYRDVRSANVSAVTYTDYPDTMTADIDFYGVDYMISDHDVELYEQVGYPYIIAGQYNLDISDATQINSLNIEAADQVFGGDSFTLSSNATPVYSSAPLIQTVDWDISTPKYGMDNRKYYGHIINYPKTVIKPKFRRCDTPIV